MTSTGSAKSTKSAGFTIAEALFVLSTITLISVISYAFFFKKEVNMVPMKIKEDIAVIETMVKKYDILRRKYPCHIHNMSDTNEKLWSAEIKEAWPTSPIDTVYFLSHTGREEGPSLDDLHYIGVALLRNDALRFDKMYDDGNLETGKFVERFYPLQHYSYELSFVTYDSHRHCE